MILGITPLPGPNTLFAVFADEGGKPIVRSCLALGLVQLEGHKTAGGNDKVVAVAFCAGLGHLKLPDFELNFVTYASDPDPEPWREQCKAKRAHLKEEAKKGAKSKIWTPEPEPLAMVSGERPVSTGQRRGADDDDD